jgi:hypothetical protein
MGALRITRILSGETTKRHTTAGVTRARGEDRFQAARHQEKRARSYRGPRPTWQPRDRDDRVRGRADRTSAALRQRARFCFAPPTCGSSVPRVTTAMRAANRCAAPARAREGPRPSRRRITRLEGAAAARARQRACRVSRPRSLVRRKVPISQRRAKNGFMRPVGTGVCSNPTGGGEGAGGRVLRTY